jgi:uncharacterized protein YfbU (UPF0304 family)
VVINLGDLFGGNIMGDVLDFEKIKEKKKLEDNEFTFQGYIDDLRYVQSVYHLLDPDSQYKIFMQTSNLLVSFVETALKDQKSD